ncbi:hypothetical protein Mapa_000445 [Marchantia paleacea]|nr:hypothetical protein Mapa_000445 [Marchantia paleacea]
MIRAGSSRQQRKQKRLCCGICHLAGSLSFFHPRLAQRPPLPSTSSARSQRSPSLLLRALFCLLLHHTHRHPSLKCLRQTKNSPPSSERGTRTRTGHRGRGSSSEGRRGEEASSATLRSCSWPNNSSTGSRISLLRPLLSPLRRVTIKNNKPCHQAPVRRQRATPRERAMERERDGGERTNKGEERDRWSKEGGKGRATIVLHRPPFARSTSPAG